MALLIQTLLCFGNVVGRKAHFVAEASKHFTNLFAVLVGVGVLDVELAVAKIGSTQ